MRLLHWLLTLGLIISFLTGDDAMRLHFWVGHGILAVILVRALMGLFGPYHVRFDTFVPTPSECLRYFKDMKDGTARRYLGHDPAGGAMIATLLTTLLLTVASGLVTYYVPARGEGLKEVHEVLANLTLFLVIAHVIGVSVSSYLQGENLIGGMISGWKREQRPSLGLANNGGRGRPSPPSANSMSVARITPSPDPTTHIRGRALYDGPYPPIGEVEHVSASQCELDPRCLARRRSRRG